MLFLRRWQRISGLVILLTFLTAITAFSQQVTGTILGRVADTSGAVVPDATIQIQDPETGFSRTLTADSDGRYLSPNLPLGTYTVTVTKPGFKTLVRSGVVLSVGAQETVNAELALGSVDQQVTVTGSAPAIDTTNATISTLVDPEQMRNLPLNGRSVDSLALLSPGVFANHATGVNATAGLGLHLSVNGARQDWNLYLLDGMNINGANYSGRSSAAGEALGVEGILEFRILTHGASAEYGRTAGGVISEVTRSGTNEFHGSAYEFVRNNIFDARNFFTVGPLPAFQRNQFGGALGGPILKNKLFFFANYEGLRGRQGIPVIALVPDAASRAAAVPVMQPFLALYTPVNVPGSDVNGVGVSNTNYSQPTREDYTMVRLDYKTSDKDSIFGRYVYDPSIIVLPDAVPTFVASIGGDDRFFVLGETHIFSPSTLNEFRFAWNRTDPTQLSFPLISVPASLSFVPGQTFGAITFTSSASAGTAIAALGTNPSTPQSFVDNLIQETDTVTKIQGAHTIKFGIDVEREQMNFTACRFCAGQFQFNSLANLMTGKPTSYSQQIIGPSATGIISKADRGFRRTMFGFFVGDDWRVRPNLTLNLGLRWEFMSNVTEVNGMIGALIKLTDASFTKGTPFTTPKANFSPRIGIAWDPTGSGKTSIRLGAGMFDNELTSRAIDNLAANPGFQTTYLITNPPFPNALSGSITVPLQSVSSFQYNFQRSVVYEWNFDVQRQFTPTISLQVGYVGSHGIHLPAQAEADIRIPTIKPDGSLFFSSSSPTINPSFASNTAIFTNSSSSYNALQVMLRKSLSDGLTFQGSYTYSKALSNADQTTSGAIASTSGYILNLSNIFQDYGVSGFDQRHTVVFSGNYQLPWGNWVSKSVAKKVLGGWSINGIFSYGSGLPLNILDGFNNSQNGDKNNVDRPNLNLGYSSNPNRGVTQGNTAGNPTCTALGGPPAGIPLHTPDQWFDPCAFSLSPAGTFGNLGRNTIGGPSLSNVDITLVKSTPLTERTSLEFRAECFNLFNHANFGLVNGTISSSSRTYAGHAGTIATTATDNREIQLGLKLLF